MKEILYIIIHYQIGQSDLKQGWYIRPIGSAIALAVPTLWGCNIFEEIQIKSKKKNKNQKVPVNNLNIPWGDEG